MEMRFFFLSYMVAIYEADDILQNIQIVSPSVTILCVNLTESWGSHIFGKHYSGYVCEGVLEDSNI